MRPVKKVKYKDWNCLLIASFYEHGQRIALLLIDADNGEPVSTCTVNLPEESLAPGETFIKNYAENEGMVEFLEQEGVVKRTGREVRSGYIAIPVCKLLIGE